MEVDIGVILTANPENISTALDKFIENTSTIFTFPELTDETRTKIWNKLYDVLNTTDDYKVKMKVLSAVRILSREKKSLNQLVTIEWLDLIKQCLRLNEDIDYKFDKESELVALEGQKSLCNIIFNSFSSAKKCCDNQILENIIKRIGNYKNYKLPEDILFFDLKLLFLLTALCPHVRNKLRDDDSTIGCMVEVLEAILSDATENELKIPNLNDKQVDTICELLKALFNVTLRADGDDEQGFLKYNHIVEILRNLLLISTKSIEKTWLLRNNVINLLTNMPMRCYEALLVPLEENNKTSKHLQYKNMNMSAIYEILVLLKAKFNEESTVSGQQELLSPIMTVLLKSANSTRNIRKYLKLCILPPLKDVHNRPEQGNELRNHLCRLLTTPITQLRDITAEFLFVLCKKNVTRMIKYTGYGNAAGLFAQRGLLGGRKDEGEADYSSDSGGSETEEYAEFKHGINPVLGCYEKPHPSPMENMTEEQKEYEAMKLVELMDNLTRCGTVTPCRIGSDGRPEPIEHVLQLREGMRDPHVDSDSE